MIRSTNKIICLDALLFGFGNNGWGNNGGGSVREEVAYGFDMNGLENGVRGIQQGLCDGFYAMNSGMLNGFAGVQSTLCQGFAGINSGATSNTNAIISALNADTIANMQNTNALAAQLHGMAADNAACCCATQTAIREGFGNLNYNLASQFQEFLLALKIVCFVFLYAF